MLHGLRAAQLQFTGLLAHATTIRHTGLITENYFHRLRDLPHRRRITGSHRGNQFRPAGLQSGLHLRRWMKQRLPRHAPATRINAHCLLRLPQLLLRIRRQAALEITSQFFDPAHELFIITLSSNLPRHAQPCPRVLRRLRRCTRNKRKKQTKQMS